MTVKTCLKWAKKHGNLGNSQESLFYLNRARDKVAKYSAYNGMEIVGFELKKKEAPKPKVVKKVKKKEKEDGKKSKG
jgi:hypothetical protein|tara:strand:- start:1110 stop:1340 length:231 start_codon:yes stop_codon:yes gene_type:complete